ncbi:MAG: stage II sporulation protein R [Clostridia bacterium]|nr:stage II sporulation protein R [Clostridia bacterium]
MKAKPSKTQTGNRRDFDRLVVEISGALAFLTLALALIAAGIFVLPPLGKKSAAVGETAEAPAGEVFAFAGERLDDRDGILRLHIIANSDSERDQDIKLAVRDAVLDFEKKAGVSLESAADTEAFLIARAEELLAAVRAALNKKGAGYDAQLMIGDFIFPEKTYAGRVYPEGEYRALRILLGNASGKNWWCVLFPPLCLIRTETPSASAEVSEPPIAEQSPGSGGFGFDSLIVRLFKSIFGEKR